MSSQPETELSGDEELNGDTAVLEQLARKREQPAAEGAEAELEPEQEADEAEESEESEEGSEAPEVDDDPEIDLGEVKAKKSEILAWKQGEMKDADYRRKTAEVAEAKRQAQAQQEIVERERSHYANQLDVLIGQLQTELIGDQQYLAQLAVEDPIAWVRQNATMQKKIERFQQAVGERQVIEQRANEEADRKRSEWARTQIDALHEKLPEWRNEAVRTQELNEMDAFLRKNGYGDGDMDAFLDHRVYMIARRAMQAEKREAARVTAKDKQVKPQPPKALKPGPAQNETKASTDAYKDAVKRAKSGREEDLLALMAAKRRNA